MAVAASARPWILGLSLSHNGAACLLHGDEIVAAVQEERLTRRKRARITPERRSLAVQYCLDAAGIDASALDGIGICSQLSAAGVRDGELLADQLAAHDTPLFTVSHHAGHAAHAFATSGLSDAAVLVVDGLGSPPADLSHADRAAVRFGEIANGWESVSLYRASGSAITPVEKHLVRNGEWLQKRPQGMPFFRSLGGMYSAAAQQIFGDDMEAGKVMGLAPYGRPDFAVSDFYDIRDGGFDFKDDVPERFTGARRWPEEAERYQNLAASVQHALEHAVLLLARRAAELIPADALCYAGGVALNVTTNERLHRETRFRQIHIPAAAEDSGPAIGAAFAALWSLGHAHRPRRFRTDSFGCGYAPAEADIALGAVPGLRLERQSDDVIAEAAARLARGEIAGWFQGGSELGPRALGNRSILADPRDPGMKDRLNARVKFREAFRPFAPAVLAERAADWFERPSDAESEFMLRAWPVKADKQAQVPAIVHADGTGRAQTVAAEVNPRFHRLISEFEARTGVPMLVNTSFNVHGEPIVETPEDALWCFLMTGIDFCVVEDRLFVKQEGRSALLRHRPKIVAELHAQTASAISFRTVTRWGERDVPLSPAVAPVLRLIDGKRDMQAIAAALQRGTRESLEDSRVADLLVYLTRAGVLTLLPP